MERPTELPPTGFFHAWYSQKCSEKFGTAIYLDENNNEVHLTEVTNQIEPYSKWDDLKYVGLVKEGTWKLGLPDPSELCHTEVRFYKNYQ